MLIPNIKNFFLFSVSITLLSVCGVGGFYLWKHEQRRHKQDELASYLLDEHYLNELWKAQISCLSPQNKSLQYIQAKNNIKKIKTNMLQDGYSSAAISAMECQAEDGARQFWANRGLLV